MTKDDNIKINDLFKIINKQISKTDRYEKNDHTLGWREGLIELKKILKNY